MKKEYTVKEMKNLMKELAEFNLYVDDRNLNVSIIRTLFALDEFIEEKEIEEG